MLEELAQVHLIEPVSQDRYRFHDLLRAYALDQALRFDSLADREHALRCLLDWYAHTGRSSDTLIFPTYNTTPQPVTVPANPTSIPDRTHAMAWLAAERDNLIAALHHTARHGLHQHALHLVTSLRYLKALGSWEAVLDVDGCGIAAAQHIGDHSAEARCLCGRGETFRVLQQWDEAQADFDQALVLARDIGDRHNHAGALNDLGQLLIERERFEQAVSNLEEALPLSRGTDTGRLEALVEANLSHAYASLGQYQQAQHHAENGLALYRRSGDLHGEACALHHLACAWHGLGEHQQAIALCRDAISLGRTTGLPIDAVAAPLDTLAVCLHHTGDTASAIACWEEAAAIFDHRRYPYRADQVRDRLRRATAQA